MIHLMDLLKFSHVIQSLFTCHLSASQLAQFLGTGDYALVPLFTVLYPTHYKNTKDECIEEQKGKGHAKLVKMQEVNNQKMERYWEMNQAGLGSKPNSTTQQVGDPGQANMYSNYNSCL